MSDPAVLLCPYPEPGAAAWRTRVLERAGLALAWGPPVPEATAAAALRRARSLWPDRSLLLLPTDLELPHGWWLRLQRAAAGAPNAILGCLSNLCPEQSPLPDGRPLDDPDPALIDALADALGGARLCPWASIPEGLVYAPADSDPDQGPCWLYPGLYVHRLDQPPARTRSFDPPWPELADAVRAAHRQGLAGRGWLTWRPGAPVLHLSHSWGGGVERFIIDLARADRERNHFLLRSVGEAEARSHGAALVLCPAVQPELEWLRWPLVPTIVDLDDHHPAYAAILAAVIRQLGVGTVVVDSLVGHALDGLRSGCPTRVVGHDYFPLWPVLHEDFDRRDRAFDLPYLRERLTQGGAPPFHGADPERWWRLRQSYLAELSARAIVRFAPSRSMAANWQALAPALTTPIQVIEHGLAPIAPANPPLVPPPRSRLRVLVPGRIHGGKGSELLRSALPALLERAELYLLGCGAAGLEFLGRGGIQVEFDYERDQLPQTIARIRPDLALLPRTVAETYSYLLGELWQLGVPVLATRTGALAERIIPGQNGFLCAPTATDLIARLTELVAEPERLHRVRTQLAGYRARPTSAMAADYAHWLRNEAPPRCPQPLDAAALGTVELYRRAARLSARCQELTTTLAEARVELARRADWAHDLDRELRQRTAWAQSLVGELERERAMFRAEQERRDAAEGALRAEAAALAEALSSSRSALERSEAESRERLRQLDERTAERDRAHALILAMRRSTSWRLTMPLRVLGRAVKQSAATLRFHLRRLGERGRRLRLSLATRGLGPTLALIWARLKPHPTLTPTAMRIEPPSTRAEYAPVALPLAEAPNVSVIIPVYGKYPYTHRCLEALRDAADPTPIEVIVIDDASPDETPTELARCTGLRVYRNAENLGFIGSCNRGAELARGEFLFFLNNDTAVQPDWCSSLLRLFAERPDAGMVGSTLLYPDGRLQEAGGIVFSDGSGWNYGRCDDPNDPRYRFVREVDYVSGAAIMLRRALFERLGRFDPRYAPAYYEDTDLAFKVRAAGWKVYLQPASRVVHFEGVSSGTDTTQGIKRYQVVNQSKFVERWAAELARQPAPGTRIELAAEHRLRGRILIADATTPTPDQDSGSLRMVNLLRLLRELGYRPSFFADNRAWVPGYSEALQQLGVEVWHHPYLSSIPDFLARYGADFDWVLLSRHYIAAPLLPLVRQHCPRARVIFDTVDLHFLREERAAALERDEALARRAQHTRAAELGLMRAVDVTLVVSSAERSLLQALVPEARIEILSNIHAVPGRRCEHAARRGLFFVGGFRHPPNVDAVTWLVRSVMPRVHAVDPSIELHVVGSNLPEEVRALATDRIRIHGHVPDIEPFLDGCRLSVAPLRYGAGVKGKINMAMSYGLPVIATTTAVEGMHLSHGVDVWVADSAADFAAGILTVYGDGEVWQRLSDGGLANVERHFSFTAARQALERILGH